MSVYGGCLSSQRTTLSVNRETETVDWLDEAIQQSTLNVESVSVEMYILQYLVDFSKKEFVGDVKIHINLKSVVPYIILDKGRCTLDSFSLRRGTAAVDLDIIYDYVPQEKLVICLSRKLVPGKYKIHMLVTGKLSEKPTGFFLVTHSEDRIYALTHFWPDHAKHVFPCFNDPIFKSVFIVSLVRPSGTNFMCASNMKPEKKVADFPSEGLTTVYFMATPPIQVMALTMIIGNFVKSDPSLAKLGYTVSVFCREELINRTKEVQDMACTIMGLIGKYTRAQFSLQKIDIVAIPMSTFPPYCMANPGIMVFSEHEVCSVSDKTAMYYVKTVRKIIHEIIHVWMGHMMTTTTWDNYCILDGVNGFLTQVVGSQMFPSWYTDWIAMHFDYQPAMDVEPWFPPSHVLESPPELSSSASQAFFFSKGASIVRMMALSDTPSFRFQMTQYFSHRGSFSKAKILYNDPNSLVVTKNMESYMFKWNKLECFPLVTVVVSGTGRVTLEQTPFGRNTPKNVKSDSGGMLNELVVFPVTCFELDQPKRVRTVWFEDNGNPIMLQTIMKPFKLNWHQSGVFRVNYTKEMWVNLAKKINEDKTFDPEDKANLLDDAFTLAEYGYIHHGVPLSLIVYLRAGTEMHPLPWLTAAKHLKNMYHRTINTDITFLLEVGDFLVKLLCSEYVGNELAWLVAKQPIMDVIRRVAIVDLSGTFLFEEVINQLKFILNEFLENGTIPLEWKRPVFEHALKGESVDSELYQNIFARYKEESNVFKKCMFWTALAGVQDENHIEQLYDIAKEIDDLDDDKWNTLIRLKILSTNCLSHRYLWPYIMENHREYHHHSPESEKDSIKRILINMIEVCQAPELLSELGDFGEMNCDQDVQYYAQKVKSDCDRWNSHNYMLFVEEWLHLYIINST